MNQGEICLTRTRALYLFCPILPASDQSPACTRGLRLEGCPYPGLEGLYKCEYGEQLRIFDNIAHLELGTELLPTPTCGMYTKRALVIILLLCPLLFILFPPLTPISIHEQCHLKDPFSLPPFPPPNCSCPSAWHHGPRQHVVAFSFYGDPTSPHMVAGQN